MPKNKFQDAIFTLIMATVMVYGLIVYNVALATGGALEINLPADRFDTFGGFVIAILGEIPKDGTQTSIDSENLHIDILEIKLHRIEKCRETKITMEESEESSEETKN